MEGVHQCCRCRGKIYSLLTAETTDSGPVCIICQRRALRASSHDQHGVEPTIPEGRYPQPPGKVSKRALGKKSKAPEVLKARGPMRQMDLFTARSGKP